MLDAQNGNRCRQLKPKDIPGLHIVPAFWSPTKDPAPFPYPDTYRWESLTTICQLLKVTQTIACATPQIWQLEPLVYRTGRDIGVPVIVVPPQNLPIIKPFSEQAGVDLVIISSTELSNLRNTLRDIEHKPKAIIVIHSDISTLLHNDIESQSIIFQEVHLVPGLPLLYQEPSLSTTMSFKRNTLFKWTEEAPNKLYVSLPTTWPVNITDVTLPFLLSTKNDTAEFTIL